MIDRDRLIDLLVNFKKPDNPILQMSERMVIEKIADYLLANGVIVPPCKVGNTVYYICETYWDKNYENYIETKELKQGILKIVERKKPKMNLMLQVKEFDWCFMNDWLNGNLFLTKEEAEEKLEELNNGTT